MNLHLDLSNKQSFIIELINDEWIHNYCKKLSSLPVSVTYREYFSGEPNKPREFESNLKQLYDDIKNIPNVLECSIPACFPVINQFNFKNPKQTQQYLNLIHRWTTYTILKEPYYIKNINITKDSINSIEKNKKIVVNFLTQLNQNVHSVESTYTKPGKSTFPCKQYTEMFWWQDFYREDVPFFTYKEIYNDIQHLFSIKNYDVSIGKRILGKDFRECWLDDDDVNCIDIQNIGERFHYNLEIDPLNNLELFYTSKEFINWIKNSNKSLDVQRIGNIPLGNIINKPDNIKYILKTCDIINVRYE